MAPPPVRRPVPLRPSRQESGSWPEGWATILAAVTDLGTEVSRCSAVHGPRHWRQVARVGIELAHRVPGADLDVVMLFALLHDSQRWTDGADPGHGKRAADFAKALAAQGVLKLSPDRLDVLASACEYHDRPVTTEHPTGGVCLDADRLCLWRLGITPDPARLSTAAARDPAMIQWASTVPIRDWTWEGL